VTAAVATPEADVDVPPPPVYQEAGGATNADVGRVSEAESTRNAFIALGVVVAAMVAIIVGAVAGGGQGVGVVLMLLVLPALALLLRSGKQRMGERDEAGRVVLRTGSPEPVGSAERTRLLEEELSEYSRDGFFVRHRADTTAQLVKPKKFSLLWALLWLLVFGIGIVVYLIYYAAKRDEGRYVEVDEYGAVRATRQVHHVL
jgi:Ca2+/Na+ antiporter